VTLESQNAVNAADGPTTKPRIRINRPDDENARYKVSRAYGLAAAFSHPACKRNPTRAFCLITGTFRV
jgi:hypothetical protein